MAVHHAMIAKLGESPYDEKWLNRPSQDHRITTRLEIAKYLGVRSASLRAHATQVDPSATWWFGLDDDEMAALYPWEDWVLGVSSVSTNVDGTLEDDLFAGLRENALHEMRQ